MMEAGWTTTFPYTARVPARRGRPWDRVATEAEAELATISERCGGDHG